MLLSTQWLIDVGSVNNFDISQQLEIGAGDTQDIYFQLIDISVNCPEDGFAPAGRRYMPAATSTVSVEMLSTECGKQIIRTATQPFPQDASIWKFSILGTDPLNGTIILKIKLVEPTRTLNANGGKGAVLRLR